MNRYILTGTPGAGKTTVIRALEARGYPIVKEAATDVVARQQARGIEEPWKSADFVDAIVDLQQQRQMETSVSPFPFQFHDRSAICCYALSRYIGQEPSAFLLAEIERLKKDNIFQQDVFFIRNLGFCEPTAARKISFKDSLVFEQVHIDAYHAFGYKLIEIEKDTVEARRDKILQAIAYTNP